MTIALYGSGWLTAALAAGSQAPGRRAADIGGAHQNDAHGVGAVARADLVEHAPQMHAHRDVGDAERLGDLLVAEPLDQQPRHLRLALGQGGGAGALLRDSHWKRRQRRRLGQTGDLHFAADHVPDRLQQTSAFDVLRDHSRGAADQGGSRFLSRDGARQHDHRGLRKQLADGGNRRIAAGSGHAIVEQHDVERSAVALPDDVLERAGFDDLDAAVAGFEIVAERRAHELMIVNEKHPHVGHCPSWRARGMRTVKLVPRPTALSTAMRPPWLRTMPSQIASPSPEPLPGGLVVKNGSKARSATAAGMPTPESRHTRRA